MEPTRCRSCGAETPALLNFSDFMYNVIVIFGYDKQRIALHCQKFAGGEKMCSALARENGTMGEWKQWLIPTDAIHYITTK